MAHTRFEVKITAAHSGMRLDLALVASDTGLSRRKIRLAIDSGGVYLNRRRIRVASRKVVVGDTIVVEHDPDLSKTLKKGFELTDADVIHLGPDFLIINKPAGLVSQATRSQSRIHVADSVQAWLKTKGELRKVILVHRLDRDTSGAMIMALNPRKALFLEEQFRERTVGKEYHALCIGKPETSEFDVSLKLAKPDRDGLVSVSSTSGRSAETRFKVLKSLGNGQATLMACYPKTGRTHQIRVHLKAKGLPIVGDKRYGGGEHLRFQEAMGLKPFKHHLLHAASLSIMTDKDRPARTFEASYPPEFIQARESIKAPRRA